MNELLRSVLHVARGEKQWLGGTGARLSRCFALQLFLQLLRPVDHRVGGIARCRSVLGDIHRVDTLVLQLLLLLLLDHRCRERLNENIVRRGALIGGTVAIRRLTDVGLATQLFRIPDGVHHVIVLPFRRGLRHRHQVLLGTGRRLGQTELMLIEVIVVLAAQVRTAFQAKPRASHRVSDVIPRQVGDGQQSDHTADHGEDGQKGC